MLWIVILTCRCNVLLSQIYKKRVLTSHHFRFSLSHAHKIAEAYNMSESHPHSQHILQHKKQTRDILNPYNIYIARVALLYSKAQEHEATLVSSH